MSNILAYLHRRLRARCTRIRTERRDAEIMRSLAENNPTCRIISIALSDTVLGDYVTILGGAILDKSSIADFSYISNNSIIRNVDIGKFCSISSSVQIGLFPHPSRVFVSTHPVFYSNDNISCQMSFRENKIFDDAVPRTVVANDVWIGTNVVVPGGIHIGTGAIVAAGAVVVKDVPPYAVVGGNPATIIRYRFTEDQIDLLLRSEWWNWPIAKLRQCVDDFADVEKFVERHVINCRRP